MDKRKKLVRNLGFFLFSCFALALPFTSCKKKEKVELANSTSNVRIQAIAYTIKLSETVVDNNTLKLPAGSVISIEPGTRKALLLKNFVGTQSNPFIFINGNGKVKIDLSSSSSYGLKFQNSKFFKLTGTGDPSTKYGILVNGPHIGISFEALSSDWEMDHVEISNIGFAGFMGKTDPSCDPATWRENFTMRNCSLHDNYVHDVTGEGFYVGNSFYAKGRALSCGTAYPHAIENMKIYNNITYATGCEGIQVGCVLKGLEVYGNRVEKFGTDPFASAQDNGIQIGEGSGGKLYNNFIKDGPGNGIIMLGIADNVVYNNVVINPGENGVFCDERYTLGQGFTFVNNTIINPKGDGFRMYSEQVQFNVIKNNIVVNPGSGKYINTLSGTKITNENNLFTADLASVKFAGASSSNYQLLTGSPAIDQGGNMATLGVAYDFNNMSRPAGKGYDIGAYEFGSTSSGGGTAPVDPTKPVDPTPVDPKPVDPTPIPTNIAVNTFTLVNADTDKDIMTITEGATIDLTSFGNAKINIRANATSLVKSVRFGLNNNSNIRTESSVPFAAYGDNNGNYNGASLAVGSYTLTGTPYSGTGASGTKGTPSVVKFTVVKTTSGGGSTTPDPGTPTNPTTPSTIIVKPSDDAFLHNGVRYNQSLIRVENGRRVAYLKFNVSGATSFQKAILKIRVDGDNGSGNVVIAKGSHNNWTESTITSSSAPVSAGTITSSRKTYNVGSYYEFDLSSLVKSNGTYTIIMTLDKNSNDFGFSSKEGSFAPQLIIN